MPRLMKVDLQRDSLYSLIVSMSDAKTYALKLFCICVITKLVNIFQKYRTFISNSLCIHKKSINDEVKAKR